MYGPAMINVESEPVYLDEYSGLGELREYMIRMMRKHNGIGLAAPQVGIFKQYFILETDDGDIVDLVNPRIEEMYGIARTEFEACLSLAPAGNGCPVERCDHVEITFSTAISEERTTRKFSYMDSRVAQHEFDHLTGTFFVDRAHPTWRKKVLDLFYTWKRKQECKELLPHMRPSLPLRPSVTPVQVS
jgi:peptide deformylase